MDNQKTKVSKSVYYQIDWRHKYLIATEASGELKMELEKAKHELNYWQESVRKLNERIAEIKPEILELYDWLQLHEPVEEGKEVANA